MVDKPRGSACQTEGMERRGGQGFVLHRFDVNDVRRAVAQRAVVRVRDEGRKRIAGYSPRRELRRMRELAKHPAQSIKVAHEEPPRAMKVERHVEEHVTA